METRVAELKRRVRAALGDHLEHATPATVREFIDTLRREEFRAQKTERIRQTENPDPPIELRSGGPTSYEGVLREFFRDMLTADEDTALIELWLFALELAYAGIEEVEEGRIGGLFE